MSTTTTTATTTTKTTTTNTTTSFSKNTDHTIFVRFVPPSSLLRRHHIEEHFSQIGPIKKASLIIPKSTTSSTTTDGGEENTPTTTTTAASSYGFIKYTCQQDAETAARQLNHSTLQLPATTSSTGGGEPTKFHVMVELASNVQKQQQKQKQPTTKQPTSVTQTTDEQQQQVDLKKKKQNRLMIRNLSFYAKESHVKAAIQALIGSSSTTQIDEIHIPTVQGKSRGFGFVTLATQEQAQKLLDLTATKPLTIKDRPVQIEFSVSKRVHQQQQELAAKKQRKDDYKQAVQKDSTKQPSRDDKEEANKENETDGDSDSDDNDNDDSSSSSSDNDNDDNEKENRKDDGDDDKEEDDDEDEEASVDNDNDNDTDKNDKEDEEDPTKILQEQRELFVRNLPFDATRHDVFEAFRSFGTIQAIYLVVDPNTKLPRGTCFVTYKTHAAAARAMKCASTTTTTPATTPTPISTTTLGQPSSSGIVINGRHLLVDYAVDKETANTLKQATSSSTDPNDASSSNVKHGRDKRNLYLKGEGRVDDEAEWKALGDNDQAKRQRAWSDKNTKLKSPLFFINPHRLSIRNISKGVDETPLKQLLFLATQRGLEKGLVSVDDLVAHWRAGGDMTARDILEKTKAFKNKSIPEEDNVLSVSSLDDKNMKRTIPSVYLDRDFDAVAGSSSISNQKRALAPSRGFAFAEFTHHVHALACLRELNNNPIYSEAYAAGGKAAVAALNSAKKRLHKKKKKSKKTTDGDNKDGGGDDTVKIPRLIVEFTVENRAKAKQQAEHRAQQQANRQKQKMETRERRELAATTASPSKDETDNKASKKRGRGAKQREKKRQRMLQGEEAGAGEAADSASKGPRTSATRALEKAEAKQRQFHQASSSTTDNCGAPATEQNNTQPKLVKPPKKQSKRQREELEAEEQFSKLVNKYKAAIAGPEVSDAAATVSPQKKSLEAGKRWFE